MVSLAMVGCRGGGGWERGKILRWQEARAENLEFIIAKKLKIKKKKQILALRARMGGWWETKALQELEVSYDVPWNGFLELVWLRDY